MYESSNARTLVLLTLAAVALVAGCTSPGSAFCSDGRICPPNTRCDVVRGVCVGSPQEVACAGYEEGDACTLAKAPGICRHNLCEPFRCGDGIRSGTELCDGADLNGKTCADRGFYGGTGVLACDDECGFDITGCTGGACGDQMTNGEELCDGSDLHGADCRTAGFYDAPGLRCSAYCTFDVTACSGYCGDKKVNGPEQCDGAPPLGTTCLDYGYARGRVGCSALCGPDLGGCSQIGWTTVLAGAFNGLWGRARDDLFAVGPKGKIVRGDGTTWTTMKSGTTEDLFRVWGSGPDDVFAVGGTSILHWNGTAWSPMRLPAGVVPGVGAIWGDVWGSGPNDVYVVGFTGPILHWDGSTWSAIQVPADSWWSGIWGSGPKDVYIVGGVIRHWDGARWSETSAPGPDKVWGSGPKDVWACGGISCTHWDGTKWSPISWGPGVNGQVSSIWGSGPNDVLAIFGRRLMHWNGTRWSETASPNSPRAIWGTGPDDVFIAGGAGIQHRTGDSWFATTTPMTISSLWAGGPDDLFVGGTTGNFECPNAGIRDVCAPLLVPNIGTTSLPNELDVVDVWGSSASDAFAVTGDGNVYHWNGTTWSLSHEGALVLRIWGSGPDDVFALGGPRPGELDFHLIHWDGRAWSPMLLPVATRSLSGLWASRQGEAFAVGTDGEIIRWDGTVWSAMESGSAEDLIDVWGSGGDDVFAVGSGGTILHYDGAKWSPMRSGTEAYLSRVRGSGRGDVFVIGGGLLFHLRLGEWERIALPPGAGVGALAVTPSRVFLGNEDTLIQLARQSVTCTGPEKNCVDGWDNDCDGLADVEDADCAGKVAEQCANLFDDDQNGKTDCADPDCANFPTCRHK